MKKLSVAAIVDFQRRSEKSKKTFVNDLRLDVEKKENEEGDGGRHYWITSLSAVSNAYKSNDLQLIKQKIDQLEEKFENSDNKRSKIMYQRNIDILYGFEDVDFKKWQPSRQPKFLVKSKLKSLIEIKGFQIQALPHHVYSYEKNDKEEVGAVWFVAKVNGFTRLELALFSDILFRYLEINFSDKYIVNPKYCIAVDAVQNVAINYSQIQRGDINTLLIPTLDELRAMM